jgi:tape measure domain-containing protein
MAAPELRLKVTLDTSFLKRQISRLPLDFAGANVSIRPKFDRQTIVNEFRLLNRYIGGKKFNITIASNLDAEIKNAERLVKALGRVQQAASGAKGGLPIGTQVLSRTKTKGGFAAAEIKALFGAAVQGGLIDDKTLASTRAQMVTALGSIGRDSIAGLLNGLKSGDADIQNAAKLLGNNLITSFKTVLGIASPSREFKKIGESAGQGFEQGLLKSIEIAEQSATRKMQRMLDRLARMALMMSGMSGPEIGRQVAQSRALPSLNFGATTPRSPVSIGPSSTGRALPPGADRPGLPGTSFASQKLLLGDLLTPSMKTAIRDAANDFIDGIRQRMNEAIRQIKVEDLGRVSQRTLTGSRVAGYLPPVARFGEGRTASPYSTGRLGREGETRAELFARREREARMRSALRGVDVMGAAPSRAPAPYSQSYRASPSSVSAIVPYAAGGAIVPSGGGGGGGTGGTGGGLGNFARRGGGGSGGFNVPQLPGSGVVREIGTEFAFAAKQVLLFGTAYKALAFLQGFPAQVGNAVGALQSFRNTLNAISPTAADAAASNQLIIDTVNKYNIPIQSARNGFTKLYASMKPAGFSGEQIGNLFLGISKASATLGLSSEKVDRVTYAFSQMASKGQLMAEEVTGQLGDVIPGALSIMAEAANMDIKTFKKAMEDGMFVGKAFEAVMSNVPIVMEKRFGKGAEGAAKTFQGALNDMQTSLTLLYEAFEPVAVGFLNAVVKPVTDGLQTITDGFNAFFTGQAAQTAGGNAFAKQLTDLKPAFDGILVNIKALIPSFQIFGGLLLNVAKFLATLTGNPIAGFLLKVYANVLLVNGAFTLLGGKILVGLIGSINTAIARFIALNLSVATLQRTSAVASSTLAGTQVQMALLARGAGAAIGPVSILRGALFGIARLGAIVVSISVAIYGLEALIEARRQIDAIRGLKSRGGTAATLVGAPREKILSSQKTARETIAQAQKELAQVKTLRAGMPSGGSLLGTRQAALEQRILDAQGVLGMKVPGAKPTATTPSVSTTGGMPAEAEAKGGGKAKGQTRESQIPQLTLALEKTKELSGIEMQIVNAQLTSNTAQLSSLELLKQLVEFKYEAKALGLEDLTTEERALKYKEIGLRREQAIFESQLRLQIDLKKERDEIQQGLSATLAGYQEEANYQQMYLDLINKGVLPSLAKVRVEAEKTFAEGEKQLNQSIEQQEANIAGLEVTIEALKLEKNLTLERQEQLKAAENTLKTLKEDLKLRGLLKGTAPERKDAAIDAAERGLAPKTVQEYISEGTEAAEDRLRELMNTGYQVVQAANAIGDAFGTAFKGLVSGSMTAQEALLLACSEALQITLLTWWRK